MIFFVVGVGGIELVYELYHRSILRSSYDLINFVERFKDLINAFKIGEKKMKIGNMRKLRP